ncbi:hypothetical protein E3Q16_03228 [Wallemia mellicola]|uniref:Uncharacterized protein n=1 Tax=Wallemia mellicola TaxID=1708541 RepID=A0AB74K9G5_9BASI|nr:hypothetical protein E3Q24_00482 [Wallemia mellicola]TIB89903.1 hypothetical protein E3Q21_00349 [Wallemia mellicola]TIB92444.1 hypothetical protein E3Q20_00333 [Wallemia mellicola]TIC03021.1 hypothetical protein E3Q16_03228 [Wallemia mellicola]TIC06363.1 hypothetical protein E3Q15_04437 [Wallemia mellicola]
MRESSEDLSSTTKLNLEYKNSTINWSPNFPPTLITARPDRSGTFEDIDRRAVVTHKIPLANGKICFQTQYK